MFQRFLRSRAHNGFEARSELRDISTDQTRLRTVASAIENAILTAEAERIGLERRIENVLARAAVILGNGTYEYLEREAIDSRQQDTLGIEIKGGQHRLAELESQIGHLRFLKTAMITRFPDFKSNLT